MKGLDQDSGGYLYVVQVVLHFGNTSKILYAKKKIQNEWFDLTMIESCSLTLDPNDDPSTPVFVAFVKRNLLADTTQINI